MASSFWGGFARTMLDDRREDDKRKADFDREKNLLELRKKYEAEIVDSQQTQIEGNMEVGYNKFGTKIYERVLSPERLAERKAKLDAANAEARRAGALAGTAEAELRDYDVDKKLERSERQSIQAAREAQTAQGWTRIAQDNERLSLDRETRSDMNRDEVTAILMEAGDEGDVSAMSLLDQYDMEFEQAKDKAERSRVIAKYKGLARQRLNKTKAGLRASSSGSSSLDNILNATVPGR